VCGGAVWCVYVCGLGGGCESERVRLCLHAPSNQKGRKEETRQSVVQTERRAKRRAYVPLPRVVRCAATGLVCVWCVAWCCAAWPEGDKIRPNHNSRKQAKTQTTFHNNTKSKSRPFCPLAKDVALLPGRRRPCNGKLSLPFFPQKQHQACVPHSTLTTLWRTRTRTSCCPGFVGWFCRQVKRETHNSQVSTSSPLPASFSSPFLFPLRCTHAIDPRITARANETLFNRSASALGRHHQHCQSLDTHGPLLLLRLLLLRLPSSFSSIHRRRRPNPRPSPAHQRTAHTAPPLLFLFRRASFYAVRRWVPQAYSYASQGEVLLLPVWPGQDHSTPRDSKSERAGGGRRRGRKGKWERRRLI